MRLALAQLKGRKRAQRGRGVNRGTGGVATGGGGVRPSHHKYKSPKQIIRIAYLKTRGLKGSNRINDRYLFIPFLRTKSQMRQTKNWSSEKSQEKDRQD